MLTKQLVNEFLDWCARHRAKATTQHYAGRLTAFVDKFGDRDFATIKPLEIDAYLHDAGHWPDGKPKAPDTIRANAISVERLQQWAIQNQLLELPIIGKIEKPTGRLRDRIPTPEETAAILAVAPREFSLIYRALRQSGARPGELCRARIEDWDRPRGAIVLTEHKTARKTQKPRVIGVGQKLEQLLNEAIDLRTSGPIFLSSHGKPWTTQRVSSIYKQLCRKSGLKDDLCLYLARHEHATQLCKKVGVHAASRALGHTNIKTTERYLHTTTEELRHNQDVFEE